MSNVRDNCGQPLFEKTVAYSRSLYEISAQTQEEFSKVVEAQFSELNRNVAAMLDKAAQSAPAGSDVAVAAMKSAIAAANSAYDSINKAAKQVAEIAEANVAAVHHDGLPGDVPSFVGGQEQRGVPDLLNRAQPAQRDRRRHLRLVLLAELVE